MSSRAAGVGHLDVLRALEPVTPCCRIGRISVRFDLDVTQQRDHVVTHPSGVLPDEFSHREVRLSLGENYLAT